MIEVLTNVLNPRMGGNFSGLCVPGRSKVLNEAVATGRSRGDQTKPWRPESSIKFMRYHTAISEPAKNVLHGLNTRVSTHD
jgi:hypothetical protein